MGSEDSGEEGRADLHLHSTRSDGIHAPAEVMRMAAQAGLAAAALADHDTVDGIGEARAAASSLGIRFIPAVEVTVGFEGRDIHVLGYFVDPENPGLAALLVGLRRARAERLRRMLARLRRLGMPLNGSEVRAQVPRGATVGRPHLAECLVRRGWVESLQDAFRYYIGTECPAYVPSTTSSPEETLRILRAAGGVPVLAHPALYRDSEIIERFAAAGLLGIEVAHPRHDPAETARLRKIAAELGLLETGGSDYHGGGRGDAPPGTQTVGMAAVSALEAAHLQLADPGGGK